MKQSGGKESGEEGQESEPALISVIFSFLLHLREVKYHWSKGQCIVFDEERFIDPHGVGN